MPILQVIGSSGAILQTTNSRWSYGQGEVSESTYKGVMAAVQALYDSYKAVAGFAPTIDQMNLMYARGLGTLTVSIITDGEPQYEMIPNELSNPIWTSDYFAVTAPALTAQQVNAVRRDFELGLNGTFTGKQLELWNYLNAGSEEFQTSSYVLRETKQTSKKSILRADYANVNRVVTPPDTATVNSLIGNLPAGEWLKKAPSVKLVGSKRWLIQTEWWWATKWSSALYGGSWTPT